MTPVVDTRYLQGSPWSRARMGAKNIAIGAVAVLSVSDLLFGVRKIFADAEGRLWRERGPAIRSILLGPCSTSSAAL
jgi:hypothetical protein